MNERFNPERLAFARSRAGFTRARLATIAGVSTSTLAKYEAGAHRPPILVESRLADALGVPNAFFSATSPDEVDAELVSFRALTRMSARRRDAALASGTIATELNDWFEHRLALPTPDVPRYARGAFDPEGSAERLRLEWELGYARVPNMVHLLEAHGVRVFSLPQDLVDVDAFSFWRRATPFVMLNCRKSYERGRFDAAHELGHLVMHADYETPRGRDREHEANRFAAAFLMPEADVLSQGLRNANAERVIAAKDRWGVAAMALAHRLHDLGVTSDWTYSAACRRLSQLGYRSGEPDSKQWGRRETSQLLEKAFALLRERGIRQADVAADLRMHPPDLSDLLFGLVLTSVESGGRQFAKDATDRGVGSHSDPPRFSVVPDD